MSDELVRDWCASCHCWHYDRALWSVWYYMRAEGGPSFEDLRMGLRRIIASSSRV
jgi:hypothetical protein